MKKQTSPSTLLKVVITPIKGTEPGRLGLYAAKAGGILEHLCPGAEVRHHKGVVTVSKIRTDHGILITKAACWGVASGMDLELTNSDSHSDKTC